MRDIIPENPQVNVALSSDGRYLAIATIGEVEVRYAAVEDWRAVACAANRELTQSEWQQFAPNTPYQAVC